MLLVLIGTILLYLCHLCQNVDFDAFCAIKCANEGQKHTICEYKCEEDSARCSGFKHYPFSNQERQDILDLHNMYRNKVASGEDTQGGNEAAKDMIALNYDVAIEVTTYCLGKRCVFRHDKCRRLAKYPSAGQNLFLQKGTLPIDGKKPAFLNLSVKQWYEEISRTDKGLLAKYQKSTKKVGHFTQIAWSTTEFLGCSRVTWTDPAATDEFKFMFELLCNYSPAGNIFDTPVYKFGTGCSPPRSPNSMFPALCGESRRLVKDEKDENEDEEPTPVYSLRSGNRPNVTGRPWEFSIAQINGRSAFLPWICFLPHVNRRLYRYATAH